MRSWTHGMRWLTASLVLLGASATAFGADQPWKYVVPDPGDRYEHGPLRALPLSDAKPTDIEEQVSYRGQQRRYAQVRFGSSNSTRVTLAIDELASGEVDLYVDGDRDRKIKPAERVVGKDRRWRFPMEAAWLEEGSTTPDFEDRTVVVQLSRSGRTLSFATAGYMEGSVHLASGDAKARRLDGDGNGAFADPDDRIWIDLDGNGQWDRFSEQFPCRPIMKLGETRYVVRTDRRGASLSLEVLSGEGTVAVKIQSKTPGSGIKEFQGLLIGRDGSAMGLADAAAKTALPVNEYRFDSMTLVLGDAEGKSPWCFSFSAGGDKKWHSIKAKDALTLEPTQGIQFQADLGSDTTKFRPGDTINVTPRVRTAEGLSLDSAWRGDRQNYSRDYISAELRVQTPDGKLLGSARSGFG